MLRGKEKLLMNENAQTEQIIDKILIFENEKMAAQLERAICEHFSSGFRALGGGKVHTSSLTYCLRKEAIKSHLVISGKNQPSDFIDIWTAMNFVRGLGSEAWFTKFIYDEINAQVDMDHESKIVAHPDAVTKDRKQIIEMKNSNTYVGLVLGDDSLKSYFRQTVYYMVMSGIEVGHVVVFYGLPMHLKYLPPSERGGNPMYGKTIYETTNLQKNNIRPFKIFTLNFSRDSSLRQQIKKGFNEVYHHINEQDFSDPASIKNFPRLDGYYKDDWKCQYCEVKKVCKKIEPDIDPELTDLLLNKLVDDNCVLLAREEGWGISVPKQISLDSSL